MKAKIVHTALFALLTAGGIFAQDVTTVRANSSDISDNLDLKAVASIFGDSSDLEDFERRLNDPDIQISNLDLNGDNRVDYLRVIEATEGNTHLIILQSVLAADTFQDVATIEVERDRNNNVQVQVVGDVYMYGANYIYEPVYVRRPVLFDIFWVSSYRPYYSPWYWGYYPRYYSYWAPYPVYRYRNNCSVHINSRNTYAYVNTRRSSRAMSMYSSRRANAYERQHPNTGFSSRNSNVSNRHALEQTRGTSTASGTRSQSAGTRNTFNGSSTRATTNTVRSTNINSGRSNNNNATGTRSITPARSGSAPSRSSTPTVSPPSRSNTTTVPARSNNTINTPSRNSAPTVSSPSRSNTTTAPVRSTPSRTSAPAVSSPSRSNTTTAPARSNTTTAPARSSNNTVRSAPAAPRQSAPAPARSGGNSGGRSSGSRRG